MEISIDGKAWHTRAPARWKTEVKKAQESLQNSSNGVEQDGSAWIRGTFRVLSAHGYERGSFQIKIVYAAEFPVRGRVPSVYLEEHPLSWQNTRDSHIEDDWKLCLFVPGYSGIDFERPDSLVSLLKCLSTFLFKEIIYQRALLAEALGGPPATWPGSARAHGHDGIQEALEDEGRPRRNDPCICGSGKKFKRCCITKYRTE